ncbi:hypothetical protein BT63DRAFT_416270 [Microthyrium microscopicum]|uniref:Uncharacterized protein n=1 Tax=Microthyrium microscopicum TaxID=703497 RepID=A0A6A6U4J7_9PEZI|nr:hypothetical protein BT63DRAFT_416270 [Microthyrium microscopicum]
MREILDRICAKANIDLEDQIKRRSYMETLCKSTLRSRWSGVQDILKFYNRAQELTDADWNCHVLVAAAHCGLRSIVKEMTKKVLPLSYGLPHSSVLGNLLSVPAEKGYIEILEVVFDNATKFPQIITDFEDSTPRASRRLNPTATEYQYANSEEVQLAEAVEKAAGAGELQTVKRLLVDRWIRIAPRNRSLMDCPNEFRNTAIYKAFLTPSLELFQWAEQLLHRLTSSKLATAGQYVLRRIVKNAFCKNWPQMLRYLFENVMDPSQFRDLRELSFCACIQGNLELFRVIVDYGVFSIPESKFPLPKEICIQDRKRAIYLAAKGGHLDIVRFLVEMGWEMDNRPLWAAVRLEHVRMIRYLQDHGLNFHISLMGIHQLGMFLKKNGLTSMLELLADEIVYVEVPQQRDLSPSLSSIESSSSDGD